MLKTRQFLRATGRLLPVWPRRRRGPKIPQSANRVNDIHSQLNSTVVAGVESPGSIQALQQLVLRAAEDRKPVAICGARHSMGGQQFAADALLIDTKQLNRVLHFDSQEGTVTVEAGIMWPELVNYLVAAQRDQPQQWGIIQKQTGADRLCIGGALSSNIHGRGLHMKPFIADIESFQLVDANGAILDCSREQNTELFRLVIGGYGLFGIVYCVTLRLARRQKVERVVKIISIGELMAAFDERIADGYLYGDFQFMTDEKSDDFLRKGVFSCYRPVDPNTPIRKGQKAISERVWNELVYLAHVDKAEAYRLYTEYYLSTNGQIYWSDLHQLSAYLDNYHHKLDHHLKAVHPATEVITELFVPRPELHAFMEEAREDFRRAGVNLIYGTIRLIEPDTESFLAWATQPYACIIFNLHTEHTPQGQEHSAQAFRRLIDLAIAHGGSYFLTYHRHATKPQIETCYPQFADFLSLKKLHDPEERFQSEWYRHYREMFEVDGANHEAR